MVKSIMQTKQKWVGLIKLLVKELQVFGLLAKPQKMMD